MNRRNESKLSTDIEVLERAIIYDAATGEIVGSHSFAVAEGASASDHQKFDALLRQQVEAMERRLTRKLRVLRSPELIQMNSFHHRVDVGTGRLIEHELPPETLKVL